MERLPDTGPAPGPVRVAHVLHAGLDPWSGLLTAVAQLARAQRSLGHPVEIWECGPWGDDKDDVLDPVAGAGVPRARVPTAGPWRLGAAGLAAIRSRDVDVVHLHGVFTPMNIGLARQLTVPYVVSPHGGYAPESLRWHRVRKEAFARLFERRMLRGAAATTALTDAEADEVRRFTGAGVPDVVVVPNGVDPPPPGVDPARGRDGLGVPPGARLAVYVGRLDVRAKRLDAAVEALASAERWHLALVGGDFRDQVAGAQALARDLGVADRLVVPGPRRGLPLHDLLAAADVVLLPSRSEGYPMSVLEGCVNATPAVVSPEVERRMGVARSGAGWCVDPAGLGAHLRSLDALDAGEWQRWRAGALAMGSRHDWARVVPQYVEVYDAARTARPARDAERWSSRYSAITSRRVSRSPR